MKKQILGHDSADKERITTLTEERAHSLVRKIIEAVRPDEDWKKFSLVMEFEAKESPDALHLSGIVLRNAPPTDKMKESGKTFEAKDGHLAVDFMKELESLK